MYDHSFQRVGPLVQESELKLLPGAPKAPENGKNMSKNSQHQFLDTFLPCLGILQASSGTITPYSCRAGHKL